MGPIMTDDGHVRPLRLEDLKEVAERDRRIQELEQLNAALAAQVDRMDVVMKAAKTWAGSDKGFTRIALRTAVINYVSQMEKLAKQCE
jgi:hypothetical protein